MKLRTSIIIILISCFSVGCGSSSRKMLVSGRLTDLNDRKPIPEPELKSPNQYYDFVDRSIFKQVHSLFDVPRHIRTLTGNPKQAINVDSFDEVPNSSWFTNRAYKLTLEQVLRGPDTVDGPDQSEPWIVKGVKTQGVTPGFRVKDSRGDTYLLKFDPLTNPEMASGAEIICTKLAYAIGYNTPENYLVHFKPEQLLIKDEVKLVDEFGYERILKPDDVNQILAFVPKLPDGRIRALASKFLPGKPKGPYSYFGTRTDDPNDRFRHEHRRELRGLYLFGSLINHNDIRRINSLDMFCHENYLKHYLIDFGSCLGSGSTNPNLQSEGFQYQLDYFEIGKALLSFGLYKFPWQRVNLNSGFPAVAYFSGEHFDPGDWKPNYPNLAFQRATSRDGFWGAKIIMSLTDEMITGIVKQAQYSEPAAEEYMIDALIKRRDAIGKYWYQKVNPLDGFQISGKNTTDQKVSFIDLAVKANFEKQELTTYKMELKYNMAHGFDQTIIREAIYQFPEFSISNNVLKSVDTMCRNRLDDSERLFYIEIRTKRETRNWSKSTKVHLLYIKEQTGFKIAGIEREN